MLVARARSVNPDPLTCSQMWVRLTIGPTF